MLPQTITTADTAFKDDTPLNTVERIKQTLKTYGIETEELWNESGVPCCYSLRVSVLGTEFGTNGKGVTKEFAMASGYGELMERLQLGRIFKADQQKDDDLYSNSSSDAYMSAEELFDRNKKWYSCFTHIIEQQLGTELSEEDILKQYCNANGDIPVTSFYCANTQTQEYLPTALLNSVYTTNGCAAGNTTEEALVQAISEIVERRFSARILNEGISVPDIPEDVLRSCKIAHEIITFLQNHGFRVIVKDCSLGTNFPVVCVCLINQKTGKYHTHFGAYPKFEIALQRTLTESFQGRNLQEVAHFDNFARTEEGTLDLGNLVNQLVKGTAEKRPEFFLPSGEPYSPLRGFSGSNNRELLKECIEFICGQGYDVLIRDCSCLGFPTYQVIVPGYSEIFSHRISPEHNDLRHRKYVQPVLRNPSATTIAESIGFMKNLIQISKQQVAAKPFSRQANLPVQLSAAEERYLMNATMAHINYKLGRTMETVRYIDRMLAEKVDKDTEYLICIKRYLTFRVDHYDDDRIRAILEYFHQPETISKLYSDISENRNLLDRFTLQCDTQCQKSCLLHDVCKKKQTDELAQIINKKLREMDGSLLKTQLAQLLDA